MSGRRMGSSIRRGGRWKAASVISASTACTVSGRAGAGFAEAGGTVLGICNGFQVLTEAHLLPGALLRNRGLRFASREVRIAATRGDTAFTHRVTEGRPLRMPVAHGEGAYFADDA